MSSPVGNHAGYHRLPSGRIYDDKNVYLQASLVLEDLSALRAPLDIPIPDPAKEELKRKKKEEVIVVNLKKTFHHETH